MSPAEIVSLDLRRAHDTGDVEQVLSAVEAVLGSEAAEALADQAADVFFAAFWVLAEDASLGDRVAAVELQLRGAD